MRIGMMVDSYKPYISGITNYVELNKRYLELAGHDVFVFTFGDLDYKDGEPRIIRSPGVPLADTGFFLSMRYTRDAKKLLQTMDIAHVHHPFLSGRLALRYCRPLHIPIVYTNHTRYDLYAQTYFSIMPEEISTSMLQAYMPSFCDATELVIAPSKGMEKVLRELKVESRIEVVPNGVDLKRFNDAKPLSRTDFGYKSDDIILVYAGRLALEKNLPFLFKSFAGIAQAIPNVHLLVIGSGVQQFDEEIRSLAGELRLAERIRFTGRVQYDRLPAYLAMCDAFVTASVTEVHPLSVIEAMAAGLPIMGIHSVGVGDTIEDGVTGLLATHDLPAFTAKLTRLCLDLNLRTQMSVSARKASQTYAIERTTQQMLKHYEKLVREIPSTKKQLANSLARFYGTVQFMTTHNQQVGKWGEDIAVEYLIKRGHEVVARNIRTPYGEIDIITKQGGIIVFVEVKTLTSSKNFFPEHNITPRKREHMLACAQEYSAEHEIDHWQIDVIAIEGKPGKEPVISYFENAIN